MDPLWFSEPLSPDFGVMNFVPTFPRNIVEIISEDDALFVLCANGKRYEVRREYMTPRLTFAAWAETH